MVSATEGVKKEAARRLERELASRNFIAPYTDDPGDREVDFLDYVKILERAQIHSGVSGGAVPFQKWDYIEELARSIADNRLVAVLKARQLGFSWTSAAYAAWLLSAHHRK